MLLFILLVDICVGSWERDLYFERAMAYSVVVQTWNSPCFHMAVYLKNPEESTEKLLQTERELRDFPSGPVANAGVCRGTSVLPMQGVGVWFLLRELDPTYCN